MPKTSKNKNSFPEIKTTTSSLIEIKPLKSEFVGTDSFNTLNQPHTSSHDSNNPQSNSTLQQNTSIDNINSKLNELKLLSESNENFAIIYQLFVDINAQNNQFKKENQEFKEENKEFKKENQEFKNRLCIIEEEIIDLRTDLNKFNQNVRKYVNELVSGLEKDIKDLLKCTIFYKELTETLEDATIDLIISKKKLHLTQKQFKEEIYDYTDSSLKAFQSLCSTFNFDHLVAIANLLREANSYAHFNDSFKNEEKSRVQRLNAISKKVDDYFQLKEIPILEFSFENLKNIEIAKKFETDEFSIEAIEIMVNIYKSVSNITVFVSK